MYDGNLKTLTHTAVVSIPSIEVMDHEGADNATVILEWTNQQLVEYSIVITPDTVVQESSENVTLRARLTLAYNIMYSVKFVARLCGNNITEVFQFFYGKHLNVNSYLVDIA